LLVVIGIIAILIGVLLPALSAARRAAATTKCAAALNEIGHVFTLYSIDNKEYYPPMRCAGPYKISFPSNPPSEYDGTQTYWMYFIAKYTSKGKFGAFGGATSKDIAASLASILWGCPAFQPITSTAAGSVGGTHVAYTGYGMNGFPEYTATYPASSIDAYAMLGEGSFSKTPAELAQATSNISSSDNWKTLSSGKWYKAKFYTKPAERVLLADARAYVLQAMKVMSIDEIAGQANLNSPGSGFWIPATGAGQSSYDFYRHGKYPKMQDATNFSPKGGTVGYNVLYADGHVAKLTTREEGFKGVRMRFPG
jgi:prepilin-type processing-associated H-X9-DG protein